MMTISLKSKGLELYTRSSLVNVEKYWSVARMKRLLFVTPGKLPVPALKGGAVETLIEMIVTQNEKAQLFEIDVFTLWDEQIHTIKYNHSNLITVKSSLIIGVLDKLYFTYWEKIKKDWRATFHRNHFRDKSYKRSLYKLLLRCQYDRIIVENNMSLLKSIYDALGEESFSKVCDYHMHSALIDNPMMIEYLTRCNQIITVSDFVRESMLSTHPDFADVKITVLKNTVDVTKFDANSFLEIRDEARKKYKVNKDIFVFLYSGRLSIEKGVKELVVAFENLNLPSVKLIIAGGSYSGDPTISQYELKIKKYCTEKSLNVDFLGFINNDEMRNIYALADVLVIPSLAKEACSLTAIEGKQLGIPMIVSNVGALPEYLGEYPIYVETDDNFIGNITQAMQQCLNVGKLERKNHPNQTQGKGWYFDQFKNIIE